MGLLGLMFRLNAPNVYMVKENCHSKKRRRELLLPEYLQVDWKKAKGMRDILTHHYANVNAEAIFYICKDKIPQLNETIKKMIEELA